MLVIDNHGILNNSNILNSTFIPWSDIKEIQIIPVLSTKFLILHLLNNKKYIESASNPIVKKLMLANQKKYGSPISITSGSLKIKFEDLMKIIIEQHIKNKINL